MNHVSKNVMIVAGNSQYSKMYSENGWTQVSSLEEADLVQFTGGADVDPTLYGEVRHPFTSCSPERDRGESHIFRDCMALDIPVVGICRGAQFVNVMSGGKMYQHVDGHATYGGHELVDLSSGKLIHTTSTHHQMMRPSSDALVLAVASESSLYEYMDDDVIQRLVPERGDDVEVVYYPAENALCFQGHPEYMDPASPCQQYFFGLIDEQLFGGEV